MDGAVLFEAIPPPKDALKYYGFSQFACGLNELSPDEREFLPPTDSRLRPDVRALELGDAAKALAYKTALEKVRLYLSVTCIMITITYIPCLSYSSVTIDSTL